MKIHSFNQLQERALDVVMYYFLLMILNTQVYKLQVKSRLQLKPRCVINLIELCFVE